MLRSLLFWLLFGVLRNLRHSLLTTAIVVVAGSDSASTCFAAFDISCTLHVVNAQSPMLRSFELSCSLAVLCSMRSST